MPSPERLGPERDVCRFAPSTTGEAHPGTLLAALLAWLDARSRGAHFIVRLEDLDPERCKPAWSDAMLRDLEWLGIDWDETVIQSTRAEAHDAALDQIAAAGKLYPCDVSRSDIKRHGQRSPDGGFAYPNLSRGASLPHQGWRHCAQPLRAQLSDITYAPQEESSRDLTQRPALAMGDPIVRRRDGAVAYNLAVIVDDAESGVTRIVRGHDIATSTATQMALMDLLGIPAPTYRHHLLLLEPRGDKLAKLHGSVGASELRASYEPAALCATLLAFAGVLENPDPVTPSEVLGTFDWQRVNEEDVAVHWNAADGTLQKI